MPPASRPRPRRGTPPPESMAVDGHQTVGELPENLNDLYVTQLREWCRKLGLSTTGGRVALQNRLEKKRHPSEGSESQVHSATTVSAPSALQLTREEIQRMISSSVQQAVADISKHVIEAYRTATEDADTTIPSNHETTESNSNPRVPRGEQQFPAITTMDSAAMTLAEFGQSQSPHQFQQQQHQLQPQQHQPTLQIHAQSLVSQPQFLAASGYLPVIPAKYIKEIESGEFFTLSKLLPKNLNRFNYDPEHLHGDLDIIIENNKLKTRKRRPEVITRIDDWTSCFTVYMSVLVQKYPFKAQELVSYLNLIRYAARYSHGLGWCIYDHKFRIKMSLNKSLSWGVIDQQLWLCSFTVNNAQLQEEYSLFSNGPQAVVDRGAQQLCHNFNKGKPCSSAPCKYRHACNHNNCLGPHPGYQCPQLSCTSSRPSSERENNPPSRPF